MKNLLLITGFFALLVMSITAAPKKAQRVVIEHVNVLPMTEDGAPLLDAMVHIENGRIVALEGTPPIGAKRINGKGKWLIPGLMDMHVHLPSDDYLPEQPPRSEPPLAHFQTQDIMTPYIANGVTQIFNLDANAIAIGRRNEIAAGKVIGPHMALAALIDGKRPDGRVALTPADGRQAVRDAKAEGYGFIKLYWRLDIETFTAICDEANMQGMKVVGHIPNSFRGKLEKAFVPGFGMIAHAEELSNYSKNFATEDATRFAQLAKANGTALTGTLTTMRWIASQVKSLDELKALPTLKYMHPIIREQWIDRNSYITMNKARMVPHFENVVAFHRTLIRSFKTAGVTIVAGTDAMNPGVVPGFSLHDELEMLVDAGLSNQEALASATRVPALWLGVANDRGTIEIGKRADIVLLDANPLEKITNTRRIAGVMVGNHWLDRNRLDAMLADLAKRYEAYEGSSTSNRHNKK
jgi:imidazolonepropionase-like amidohydrolase